LLGSHRAGEGDEQRIDRVDMVVHARGDAARQLEGALLGVVALDGARRARLEDGEEQRWQRGGDHEQQEPQLDAGAAARGRNL
jgi:hypothetical protein